MEDEATIHVNLLLCVQFFGGGLLAVAILF